MDELWDDSAMSAPDLTPEMMNRIRDSGLDQHLTLLLGAGASTTSGLPDWDTLAVRLLMRTHVAMKEDAARLLVSKQDALLVAEAARKATGAQWDRRLKSALYEGTSDPAPSPLHGAVAGHLLDGPEGETTLITLNFDTLLEEAIRGGTARSVISGVNGAESPDSYTVHHLHGIVSPTTVQKVVLTLSDFNNLLGDEASWQLELLRTAVKKGALVIAGTSYRDPDLRRWLHVAFDEQPPQHAALVLLAREAFSLDKVAFAEVKEALASQWRAAGLEPVILEDFTDAAQLMRELRHLHRPAYVSPQERARVIWEAHVRRFSELQQEYSNQLNCHAAVMKEALDVDQVNVTLWLANGRGQLARWTAHDRCYRAVDDLRLVDSGHDSRWIAGRALATEELLFHNLGMGQTQRWGSVLAIPIRVEYPDFPEFATAVISVGLPDPAKTYETTRTLWLDALLTIANYWSALLISATFPAETHTLNQ